MHLTESWDIMNTMKLTIACIVTVLTTGAFAGLPAQAHQPASPGCHVASVSRTTQHSIVAPWLRLVTTTTSKCHGRLVTTVAYGPWHTPSGHTDPPFAP